MKLQTIWIMAIAFLVSAVVTSSAEARERVLVKKALADATLERADIEKEQKLSNHGDALVNTKAIQVEIGDELGAARDTNVRMRGDDTYREKAVSVKLDREWKDVNKGFTKDRADNRGNRL